MPRRNVNPEYRCPAGGFHKFGKRKRLWIFFSFGLMGGKASANTRKCRKCKRIYGPEGLVR